MNYKEKINRLKNILDKNKLHEAKRYYIFPLIATIAAGYVIYNYPFARDIALALLILYIFGNVIYGD